VPDPAVLRAIGNQAWAPALQMVGNFLVNVYFLRLAGEFSDKAQAAYSIGLRVSMVGPMLAFPLAGACATLVGQNLGAGNVRRAWQSMWVGLAAHASLLIGVGAALFIHRVEFVGFFADDPEVVALGSELVAYQAGAFFFWAFYFVFFRTLQGAGDVFVPMVLSSLNALFVTLPIGWYLATQTDRGPTGLFQATLVGAAVVTLTLGSYVATGRWTRIGRSHQRQAHLDPPVDQ
jgi:Na+-driven multidrug efflux pump